MTAIQRLDEALRLALIDALRTIARRRPFQEVADAYGDCKIAACKTGDGARQVRVRWPTRFFEAQLQA